MKRIAILVVTVLMSLTASAHSIRYFTYAQAQRTVQHLNAQQELMLYCGYDYEIETYVLINEVWMERVNSAYYELWVYGYDAYTGDEVYMPLDLQCVWLYSAGRMYNAAQYLRFHTTVRTPSFTWYVPHYHPFTRRVHIAGYMRTYHYDIHRHGWMPPAPPMGGWGPHTQPPLPPYYMRTPQTPPPAPTNAWTPGVDRPQVAGTTLRNNTGSRSGSTIPTTRPSTSGSSTGTPAPTQRNSGAARSGNSGSTTTRTGDSGTTTRSTGTTPTRTNAGTRGTTTRSTNTATGTTTRDSGTGTTTRSGNTTTTRGSATGTTTRSGNTTTTRGSATGTTTRSGNTTTTRSSATGTATRSTGSAGTSRRNTR